MRRRSGISTVPAVLGAAVLVWATAVVAVPAVSTAAPVERTETVLASSSPITSVVVSAVSLKLPLPASAGARPAACDWVSYLRFRDRSGPASAAAADRILVAQPGVLEGAGAFDSVARNTIVQAAAAGRHIEFWALDRRSNCLEDHTGVRAAVKAKNVKLAVDYYYNKKSLDGSKFGGYLDNDHVKFLEHVGLAQTLQDEYDVLRTELPDAAVRREKVLCGGHSLGGTLTGYFADWDFDGNAATTDDAGYNQCGGYFALDTVIGTKIAAPDQAPTPDAADAGIQLGAPVVDIGLATGLIPRTLSFPAVINAETMNLLSIAGAAALSAPTGESTLAKSVPSSLNVDLTYRLLASRDLGNFVTGNPSLRDYRITNEGALGFLLDDQSMPLAFLQTSVGFFDGGPVVDKNFPVGNDLSALPADLRDLFTGIGGTQHKAGPGDAGPLLARGTGPLYRWRNYDQVGKPGDPGYKSADGTPFTSAGQEVSDIGELARSMADYPLDFTEQYFPTRMLTDISLGTQVAEVKAHYLHTGGVAKRPVLTLLAGGGVVVGRGGGGGLDALNPVILPGYQHLDVLTAAPTQNDGKPEQVSVRLAAFTA